MKKNLEDIVEKLNKNLPEDTEYCFCLTSSRFWDSIGISYSHGTISLWDSENCPSEPTYFDVLGAFQKIVLELFHISQIGKEVEKSLSCLYTDFLMLEDETWVPDKDSIKASLENLEEVAESILELELTDTRDNGI
tara:strand:- start:4517 stop:4924 length:408 start_codon:yes stop_codon:yes gene_type:complete